MKLNSQNFNERITATSIFFENALGDPEMLSGFEIHGYTAEKLGEGKTVLDVVKQKQITKNTAHAAKHAATQIFRTNRQAAHKFFMRLVGFSNVAFSADTETREKLGIHKRIPAKYADWLITVEQFYTVLLTDESLQTKLAAIGIKLEEFQAGHQLVLDTKAAANARVQKDGKAQQSTKERNIEFHKLEDFMSNCISIAKLAFDDKPQFLERLGIVKR